jgi:hypothetical protein
LEIISSRYICYDILVKGSQGQIGVFRALYKYSNRCNHILNIESLLSPLYLIVPLSCSEAALFRG